MCRDKTCLDWYRIGHFTCGELRGLSCRCDGCCNVEPPPPPEPPSPPPSPPPAPPPPSDPAATLLAVALSVGGVLLCGMGFVAWRMLQQREMRQAGVKLERLGSGVLRATPLRMSGAELSSFSNSSCELSSLSHGDVGHPATASDDSNESQSAPGPSTACSPDGAAYEDEEAGQEHRGRARSSSLTKRMERFSHERYKPLGGAKPLAAAKRATFRKGRGGGCTSSTKPLAAGDGGGHSLLRAQSLAWQAALRSPEGAMSTDDDTDGGCSMVGAENESEIKVEALLDAFAHTLIIGAAFGPLLSLGVKNDEANTDKARQAWTSLSATRSITSLRALLEAERATGIHQPGGVLADPSAAIALVWLRRSLAFQNGVLEALHADRHGLVSHLARESYKTHLEQFHNFWLKNTFRAGLSAMPKREDFLQRLSPNVSDDDRERVVYEEMAELVEIQNRVGAACSRLFVELDLEDTRKV